MHWVFRIGAAHRAPHSWVEHIRLVDAIEAGDADAAEAAAALDHVHAAEPPRRSTERRGPS